MEAQPEQILAQNAHLFRLSSCIVIFKHKVYIALLTERTNAHSENNNNKSCQADPADPILSTSCTHFLEFTRTFDLCAFFSSNTCLNIFSWTDVFFMTFPAHKDLMCVLCF